MMPKLSVITACFNHGRYLAECIESVLAQTEQAIEHIVVIDGATDNSEDVAYAAMKGDDRVSVYSNTENKGLAYSQNLGISLAQAPWVLKVDADDKIDRRYVEEILKAADEDSRRNVIFAPAKHFGKRDDVFVYPPFDPTRMIDQFMIPGPAGFKRDLWSAVGGYDESMPSAEDWDFYIRAQVAVGLVPYQLDVPGLYWWYRVHDGPRASTRGIAQLPELQQYWRGHTRASALGGTRSWGQWCRERGIAA